jgi:hypothetical protein
MRRGGVACNAGGRQAAPLQRVEDEDEFEDEDDWLRLRRARGHAGYPLKRISGKPRTSAPKANRPPASGCSLSSCSDRPIEADVT